MKVSIIVPVYNVESYLEHCLDTLVHQTLQDIEIIVVNDGSTDGSNQIIERYQKQYHQILKSYDKPNGGLSDARNFGLQYAQGEYIGFIDSDDFVDLDMFEKMYEKAIETNADIVACNLHHTFTDEEDTEVIQPYTDKRELISFGCSVAWNKIYNRDWLNQTGVKFLKGVNHEDIDFFCLIVPYIRKIEYIEQACVHYVQREGSINNARSEKLRDIHKVFMHLNEEYVIRGLKELYGEAVEALAVRVLLGSVIQRFSKIQDVKLRRKLLKENWEFLNQQYPNWKQNKIIFKDINIRTVYYKCCNYNLYKMVCKMLELKNKKS